MPPADAAAETSPRPEIPDYELLRVIGRGGYGDVWLARGLTGVFRAIKVVWRNRYERPEPFEREFKGLKKFMALAEGEAGQLALLHVGQSETQGFFYYVMELADDADSGRAIDPARYTPLTLREVKTRRGCLPAAECLAIATEIARGLAALHARGLVHRDVKPSNIILVNGRPKLADIGLVAAADEAYTYVGTEGYVPPEGPGKPAGDVYALGRLLYELATGLDKEDFPRLPADLERRPDRRVFLQLNTVILRASDPANERRYRDAGAMVSDLAALAAPSRSSRRGWFALVALALAAAVAIVATVRLRHPPGGTSPAPASSAPAAKSIAVLPFEDLNEDKEDRFFADGIHEEILTDLANLASLRVISRTSVMAYRGTTKNLAEIGRELGVDYILEGSVRRVGTRVRVSGQLIRAAADEHLWAQSFDGDTTDALTLQVRLATAIAEQLQAVLTPAEAQRLSAVTVTDPKAHDLYLRGREAMRHLHEAMEAPPEVEALFRQATELDPKFALPWVELAGIHVRRYFDDRSRVAERDAAKVAIDRALALAPGRAEVQAGLGEYYYYGFADYAAAAEHYQNALALEPSNAEVHQLLGLLARRQLRWRQALVELRTAHELDPLNSFYGQLYGGTLGWTRDYAGARLIALEMARIKQHDILPRLEAAFFETNRLRSPQPLGDFLASLTPAERDSDEAREARGWLLFESGDAAGYVKLASSLPPPDPDDDEAVLDLAIARRVLGQDYLGPLVEHRARLEAGVRSRPEDSGRWVQLARNCSLQGDRARAEEALAHADAVEPRQANPLEWEARKADRVFVLAWLGDKDAAIDLFARTVRLPGPGILPYNLKAGLEFWPLRGQPRFEAILADPKSYEADLEPPP